MSVIVGNGKAEQKANEKPKKAAPAKKGDAK